MGHVKKIRSQAVSRGKLKRCAGLFLHDEVSEPDREDRVYSNQAPAQGVHEARYLSLQEDHGTDEIENEQAADRPPLELWMIGFTGEPEEDGETDHG